jgi:ABC-type Mn2+/Zn2+ transport system ATPase subunit
VLVVEHDPDVMAIADHIVDIGPKAGTHGGEVVFEGSYEALKYADTLTGQFLKHHLPVKQQVRQPTGHMIIQNATMHNLKNLTVKIPTGVLTVVTGVAGSGKSTLINDVFLTQHPDALVIDQSRVAANSRSAPATYTGIMDDIRQAFAKANKVSASLFSFNSEGSCPNCNGLGVVYVDLAFMEGIASTCEICEGKRFKSEVLAYHLRGKSISDVLEMTAEEALGFFTEKKVKNVLQAMNDVGLGYLRLGQPLSTLSGGECQRIKLASELHKSGSIYVMDEPTTGLHMSDVGNLLAIMDRLADGGNTVIVIEHNLDVIKNADWIIDLGPEAGRQGGQVVFEGTPQQLLAAEHSWTGNFLQQNMGLRTVVNNTKNGDETNPDIFALGREMEAHISANWEKVFKENQAKLLDAYERAGDMAYGTYLDLLFRPIHRRLREAGMKAKPRLPGDFSISREWGVPDESDQQRWMWSTILGSDGEPIGTIVTITHHDHTRFHIPRQPQVIGLAEVGKEAVVEALSQRSEDFKNALEFTIEYELYLKRLETPEPEAM